VGILLSSFIYGQDSMYYDLNFDDKIPRNYNLGLQKADFYAFQSNLKLPLSEKVKLLAKVISFRSKNKTGRKATIYRDRILQSFADSLKGEWKLEWEGTNYVDDGEVPLEEDKERIIFKEDVIVQTKNKERKILEYEVLDLGVDCWNTVFLIIKFENKSWIVYIDEVGINNRRASVRIEDKKGKRFLYMQERWIACGAIEIFGSRPYSDKKN
jgi:hypothetical protein